MDKNHLNEEIGIRIRRRREVLGCTREQIAERANISVSIDFLLLGTEKNGERQSAEWEQLFSLLVPEQRELAEEMLRLFVRGVSISGKAKKI